MRTYVCYRSNIEKKAFSDQDAIDRICKSRMFVDPYVFSYPFPHRAPHCPAWDRKAKKCRSGLKPYPLDFEKTLEELAQIRNLVLSWKKDIDAIGWHCTLSSLPGDLARVADAVDKAKHTINTLLYQCYGPVHGGLPEEPKK